MVNQDMNDYTKNKSTENTQKKRKKTTT